MNKIPKKIETKIETARSHHIFLSVVTIVGSGHQFSITDNNAAAKQGMVNDVSFVFVFFSRWGTGHTTGIV